MPAGIGRIGSGCNGQHLSGDAFGAVSWGVDGKPSRLITIRLHLFRYRDSRARRTILSGLVRLFSFMARKKIRRAKPYIIQSGGPEPCEVRAADWQRFAQLGLIEPICNDGVQSSRVARLCEGVVAWIDAGRIVLQNTMMRVWAYVRTSWAAIERNCPVIVSQETIDYYHCRDDRERALWDAQRAAVR